MSRQHRTSQNAQIAVLKAVAKQLDAHENALCEGMNHLVERTGEAIILLSAYIAYRMERMNDGITGTSPFVQKLRGRTNQILRACDDFAKVLEPYISDNHRGDAYLHFSDVLTNALDSLFDDMHRDYADPSLKLLRRAKLRYHDPFKTDVAERTAAFEDGYCKGYTDAMDDFMKEVANVSEGEDKLLSVTIGDEGKITIKQQKK